MPQQVNRPPKVAEAAEALGLSVHTLRAWITQRRLNHVRLGRAIRVLPAEIQRLLKNSAVPARDGLHSSPHPSTQGPVKQEAAQ
jgi:excisionase family DNA binding protein